MPGCCARPEAVSLARAIIHDDNHDDDDDDDDAEERK